MIVVDASVFAFALLDEGPLGKTCRDALSRDPDWIAPEHWLVEVLSVVRGNHLGGKIGPDHAADAVAALHQIQPVTPHTRILLARMWELRGNLSTYGAAYVAAAEAYGCRLLTTDARLARAPGIGCDVDVLS